MFSKLNFVTKMSFSFSVVLATVYVRSCTEVPTDYYYESFNYLH